MSATTWPAPPLIAVLYDTAGFSPFQIASAARGVARIAWVADPYDLAHGQTERILRKFGEVVSAGRSDAELVHQLQDLGCSGVVAFTDSWLERGARVAADLTAPFHTVDCATALVDKARQRSTLRDAGIDVPAFAVIRPTHLAADMSSALDQVPLPAVLKPCRGTASRHTLSIREPGDLEAALAGAPAEEWLLEEHLEAATTTAEVACDDVLSVETVVRNGVQRHIATAGRFPFAEPFRDTGGFVPAHLPPGTESVVMSLGESAIKALGVTDGCCHTEIKLTPAGPRVIEVNGRIGGHVPQMLAAMGGPSLLEWAIRIALGLPDPAQPQPTGVAYFLCEQPPVAAQRIAAIEGLTAVSDLRGVDEFKLHLHAGSHVDWRVGATGFVYAVYGIVPDHESLWRTRREILDTVVVSYE